MARRGGGRALIDLAVALREMVWVLEQARVRYIIVGSVAASAWGVVRMTRDVDVVVVVDPTSGQTMLDTLAETDLYVPTESARQAVATEGSFNILHPPSGGKVDVFVMPPSDEFTNQRLNDRVSAVVFDVDYLKTWATTLTIQDDMSELLTIAQQFEQPTGRTIGQRDLSASACQT